MRAGAIDYVAKPFDHDELLMVIDRSLSQNRMQAQNTALLTDMERLLPSPAFLSCTEIGTHYKNISAEAGDKHNLFIAGERGVGRGYAMTLYKKNYWALMKVLIATGWFKRRTVVP